MKNTRVITIVCLVILVIVLVLGSWYYTYVQERFTEEKFYSLCQLANEFNAINANWLRTDSYLESDLNRQLQEKLNKAQQNNHVYLANEIRSILSELKQTRYELRVSALQVLESSRTTEEGYPFQQSSCTFIPQAKQLFSVNTYNGTCVINSSIGGYGAFSSDLLKPTKTNKVFSSGEPNCFIDLRDTNKSQVLPRVLDILEKVGEKLNESAMLKLEQLRNQADALLKQEIQLETVDVPNAEGIHRDNRTALTNEQNSRTSKQRDMSSLTQENNSLETEAARLQLQLNFTKSPVVEVTVPSAAPPPVPQPPAPSPNSWQGVPGLLMQASTDGNNVCGVTGSHTIFCSPFGGTAWTLKPGLLRQISVDNGKVCGVTGSDDVFCSDSYNNIQWKHVPGKLRQIDVSGNTMCGVDGGHNIFCASFGRNDWSLKPGLLRHISIDNGRACGVTGGDDVFCADNINNPNWQLVPGKLRQIDLSGNKMCGVDGGENIFCADYKKNNWELKPGKAKNITLSGTRAYVTNNADGIFYQNQIV
jgi:hypothetical protein